MGSDLPSHIFENAFSIIASQTRSQLLFCGADCSNHLVAFWLAVERVVGGGPAKEVLVGFAV